MNWWFNLSTMGRDFKIMWQIKNSQKKHTHTIFRTDVRTDEKNGRKLSNNKLQVRKMMNLSFDHQFVCQWLFDRMIKLNSEWKLNFPNRNTQSKRSEVRGTERMV